MKVQDLQEAEQQLQERAVERKLAVVLESALPDDLVMSAPMSAEDVIAELFK